MPACWAANEQLVDFIAFLRRRRGELNHPDAGAELEAAVAEGAGRNENLGAVTAERIESDPEQARARTIPGPLPGIGLVTAAGLRC